MRILDPASLARARIVNVLTLSGSIEVIGNTSVRGEFADDDKPVVLCSYQGRLHLLKSDEVPQEMRVEGVEFYAITLPAGAKVDGDDQLRIKGEMYNVVGDDPATLGGEIKRIVYARKA